MAPAVLVPHALAVVVLFVGLVSYRRDVLAVSSGLEERVAVLGPVFVAAALAAFAGEHFTAAESLAQIVAKWLPGAVFIAYLVGVAHLSAALSFASRRYVRIASMCLAIMFSLFVLLMDLPGAVAHPTVRMAWSLAARETTFAVGALALWLTEMQRRRSPPAPELSVIVRMWTACVLVFYGLENLVSPQFAPGVPDTTPTAAWIPAPHAIAYIVGFLLVAIGGAMLVGRNASAAAARGGLLMLALTVLLYVPQCFVSHSVGAGVTALNFVYDTLLFAGMLLVISGAIRSPAPERAIAAMQVA